MPAPSDRIEPLIESKRRTGMTTTRSLACVSIVSLLVVAAFAVAQDKPAAAPGAQAASQPATAPALPTQVVKKGRLSLKIDAAGTFLPASPVEVRIRPDAYQADLKVVSAAANGAAV